MCDREVKVVLTSITFLFLRPGKHLKLQHAQAVGIFLILCVCVRGCVVLVVVIRGGVLVLSFGIKVVLVKSTFLVGVLNSVVCSCMILSAAVRFILGVSS